MESSPDILSVGEQKRVNVDERHGKKTAIFKRTPTRILARAIAKLVYLTGDGMAQTVNQHPVDFSSRKYAPIMDALRMHPYTISSARRRHILQTGRTEAGKLSYSFPGVNDASTPIG